MLKKLEGSAGNVLAYEVEGKLTREELEALAKEFKTVVADHGKVRLLVRIPEMPAVEFGAVAEDLKLAPYARDIERYALVGDTAVAEWAEKVGDALVGGEMKHFEDSQYEEAWRWVQS